MVGRTQAENIANRLAGNEPLGLMESMKRAGTGTGALGNLRQEVVDYQKKQGVKNPEFISKTGLTDFFANNPKYSSLDVAPSSIGGKTQPFSTRSWFRKILVLQEIIQHQVRHPIFGGTLSLLKMLY